MRFLRPSSPDVTPQFGGHLRAFFEAGWRPLLGWIGTAACALAFLYIPALNSYLVPNGKPAAPPADLVQTLALLGTVLTTAGLRTYEKICGVATPTDGAPVAPPLAGQPQPVAG